MHHSPSLVTLLRVLAALEQLASSAARRVLSAFAIWHELCGYQFLSCSVCVRWWARLCQQFFQHLDRATDT